MSKVKVHTNLTYKQYEAIDAVRQSWLQKLAQSPAHLKYHLDCNGEDEEESAALRIGSAVDCAVFFPEQFPAKYVQAPNIDKRTKEGKAAWSEFEFENQGKTVLKHDEYNDVLAMCHALAGYKTVDGLLDGSHYQLAIEWTDEYSGVRCKARLDGYNERLHTAFDLKTTRSVSDFRRSLDSYGYHRQAAFYTEACRQADLNPEHFVFIAVEKTPPYPVGIFRLSDIDVRQAWESCKVLLMRYKHCMESNSWPCYPDVVQDIALADWQRAKLMEA